MSDTKHTPGPWHWVNPQTDEPWTPDEFSASLRTVAEFKGEYGNYTLPRWILDAEEIRDDDGRMEANARLIAAAPDLLEALCLAHDYLAANGWDDDPRMAPIRAAIAKALAKPTP